MNREYYYCYSTNLFKFLRLEKGFRYICSGLNEKTLRKFWQFERTEELGEALVEYKEIGNELKK